MLLNAINGCTSFEDIWIINDVLYPTFKVVCYAIDFLHDDKDWHDCLKEESI